MMDEGRMVRGKTEEGRRKREDGGRRTPVSRGSSPFLYPLPSTFFPRQATLRPCLLTTFLLVIATVAEAADPFYLRLLRQGTDAYNRRDFVAAERQLRTACFGLLDEPEVLADGLVRLGLAQAATGDTTGFAASFQRVAEVEERFGGYSKAALPADIRGAYQRLVLKLVPGPTLAERPAMARLMPTGEERTGRPTPTPVTPVATATPTRPAAPPPTRTSVTRPTAAPTALPAVVATPAARAVPVRSPVPTSPGASGSVAPLSSAVASAAPSESLTTPPPVLASPRPTDATPPPRRAPTVAERGEFDAIQELVRKNRIGDALARARRLADGQVDLPEAQFVAGELAYRTLRWPEAVEYFRRGGDPGDERPLLLFYQAVALYETGDTERAAVVLKRALPNIRRTSYVEGYVKRISTPAAEPPPRP